MLCDEFNQEQGGVATLPPEFVPVSFTSCSEQVEEIRGVLERNDIPVIIGDAPVGVYTSLGRGIPLLVPNEMHDRASEIVADYEELVQANYGVDDDEDDDDLDDDFYDDDDEEYDDDFDDLDDLDDDYDDDLDDDLDVDDDL